MTNLYISGTIDEDTLGDVIDVLSCDTQQITLFIHSGGGLATVGFAIYDLIKDDPRVDTYMVGLAGSAAGLIFMGGTRRAATDMSRLMVHRSHSTVRHANKVDLLESVEESDFWDMPIQKIYEPFLTKKQLKMFLDGEDVYLTHKQMRKQGVLK